MESSTDIALQYLQSSPSPPSKRTHHQGVVVNINLESYLTTLRRTHGIMHVAVISKNDYARRKAILTGWSAVQVNELPDGRATIQALRGPAEILNLIYESNIQATSWIELHEYDDRYEEATYTGDIDGRYVRVQTGMLDDLFGYVAVQSPIQTDIPDVIEDIHFKSTGRFDAIFERLAVPVHVTE